MTGHEKENLRAQKRLEFGQKIRLLRERSNLSLADLHQTTKIPLLSLEALELGNYDHLPSKIFVVGFVKGVSRALGADEKELLADFESVYELDAELDVEKFAVMAAERRAKELASGESSDSLGENRRWGWVLFFLVLVLAGGGYFYKTRLHSHPETSSLGGGKAVGKLTEEKAVKLEELVAGDREKGAEEVAVGEAEALRRETEMKALPVGSELLVKVLKKVRVRVRVDGGESELKVLEPQTLRFQVLERADLFVFDAPSVQIVFNNRKVGSLGREGRRRKLSFVNDLRNPINN